MRTIKCPVCHSNHTVKNGRRKGLSCINVPNAAISSAKVKSWMMTGSGNYIKGTSRQFRSCQSVWA